METSQEERQIVKDELQAGESVLWDAKPDPVRSMRSALPIFLFGIPWTAMCCSMFSRIGHERWGVVIFELGFVLVGVGMLLYPVWVYLKARSTINTITSRRVIIVSGRRSRSFQSFYASDLKNLMRIELANGTGDVQISTKTSGTGTDATTVPISLIGIPRPREVEELIRTHILSA